MIQANIIFYNDTPELLERCLKSIKNKVDYILAIDGCYTEFPHDKCYSTDGCLDIAKKYADSIIECKKPWKDQIHKRNAYLTDIDGYHFILDADEELIGSIPKLEHETYAIKIHNEKDPYHVRFFKSSKELRYSSRHCWLRNNQKILSNNVNLENFDKLTNCYLIHHKKERSLSRKQDKLSYYQNRLEGGPAKLFNISQV